MPTGRRVALAVAAGWLVVVLALYLAILRSQGDPADPAWWFVALLGGCEVPRSACTTCGMPCTPNTSRIISWASGPVSRACTRAPTTYREKMSIRMSAS